MNLHLSSNKASQETDQPNPAQNTQKLGEMDMVDAIYWFRGINNLKLAVICNVTTWISPFQ